MSVHEPSVRNLLNCVSDEMATHCIFAKEKQNIIIMEDIFRLVNEMSPYLLLGFLVAGLLHAFVPGRLYSKYLSGINLRSVLLAALFGIPLPLCSCGVIPTAMSLRREGASRGATTSFLIATPQTGADSILATYSLLGLPFALIRPIAALVTSVFGGMLVNAFDKNTSSSSTKALSHESAAGAETSTDQQEEDIPKGTGFVQRLGLALRYGFVDMVRDIGKWLVIGLVIAALITLFVPDDFFMRFANHRLLTYGMVLLIGIPMYVCATGSIPVAAALMLKGLSPGAALVFLMAGPASNMASILVIQRVMGRRTLLLYLLSITLGALFFGLGADYLLPQAWFVLHAAPTAAYCHVETPWFQWTSTGVMVALLVYAFLVHPWLSHRKKTAPSSAARRFKVEGMTCHHCQTNVEKALRQTPGVTHAEVDLERGEAIVQGTAPEAVLVQTVAEIGYTLKNDE